MDDPRSWFYSRSPRRPSPRSDMPTYEYTCKSCGQNFEVFQSFADKPLKKHKECGGQLQKVFHVRGIVFKGSGFYATDSKGSSTSRGGDGADPGSKSESPSKKDSGSKTDSGSKKPSKPEPKTAKASTTD